MSEPSSRTVYKARLLKNPKSQRNFALYDGTIESMKHVVGRSSLCILYDEFPLANEVPKLIRLTIRNKVCLLQCMYSTCPRPLHRPYDLCFILLHYETRVKQTLPLAHSGSNADSNSMIERQKVGPPEKPSESSSVRWILSMLLINRKNQFLAPHCRTGQHPSLYFGF